MGEQQRQEKFDYRKAIIKETKNLKFMDNTIAMAPNKKKGSSLCDLLADMDLSIVKDLSLCSRQLTHLPEELGVRLKNLVDLDLSNNNLDTLPHSLRLLTHLQTLNLSKNNFETPPETITQIWCLQVLQLAKNRIKTLPHNLGDLKHLVTLNLSSNSLTELPESCVKLNRLKTLDLSENNFKLLPNCVTRGMRSLKILDVSGNLYINVAMAPASKKLRELYVRNAGTNIKFPAWLLRGRAPELRVLKCDGTKFKIFSFPNDRPSLKLHTISFQDCRVYDQFADAITSQTDELRTLRLGNYDEFRNGNGFWEVPIKNLKRPKLLTELNVRGTTLPNLCREIGNLSNLVKLDVGNNSIYCLPDEICLLSKLEILLVDDNDLSSLPDNIGAMTSLKELKANGNHLGCLPESVKELKHLVYLDLYNNEFTDAPETFNSLESLLGVDIDQNNFEINDLHIRDLRYEAMRSILRNRYQTPGNQRSTGPRYESDAEELNDSSSDISSMECDEPYTTVRVDNANTEEDWDVSDNSADEYEPCYQREKSKETPVSFTYVLSQKFAFCPADIHKLPISRQVALKKQKGELEDHSQIVEGQFDDA